MRSDIGSRHVVGGLLSNPSETKWTMRPLRRPPAFGVYLWWPEAGTNWIHPDDVPVAERWIPSDRVFCRVDGADGYSVLRYGHQEIRVRPTMWLEVSPDGYEVGDLVEVKSQMGRLAPFVATIMNMFWNRHRQAIEYELAESGQRLPRRYEVHEFQPARSLQKAWDLRLRELAARHGLV